MAEGVGFEPTVGCPTLDFESSALNRTQPPFRFLEMTCGSSESTGLTSLRASLHEEVNRCKPLTARRDLYRLRVGRRLGTMYLIASSPIFTTLVLLFYPGYSLNSENIARDQAQKRLKPVSTAFRFSPARASVRSNWARSLLD